MNNLCNFCSVFLKCAEDWESKYIGIKLTPDSKNMLLQSVSPKFGKIKGKGGNPGTIFAEHVTVEIEPTDELLEKFGEGERIPINVVGECYDDKAQAVLIQLPEFFEQYIREKDRLPHVTISTAKGVSPVYSNELVRSGENFTPQHLLLQGHVKFLLKK